MIKFLSKAFGSKKKKTEKKEKNKKTKTEKPELTKTDPLATSPDSTESEPIANDQLVATSVNESVNENVASKPVSPEREKLIENALAVHREKSKMLDSLPPSVRTKLTAMAMAIYIKQRSDNEKN